MNDPRHEAALNWFSAAMFAAQHKYLEYVEQDELSGEERIWASRQSFIARMHDQVEQGLANEDGSPNEQYQDLLELGETLEKERNEASGSAQDENFVLNQIESLMVPHREAEQQLLVDFNAENPPIEQATDTKDLQSN